MDNIFELSNNTRASVKFHFVTFSDVDTALSSKVHYYPYTNSPGNPGFSPTRGLMQWEFSWNLMASHTVTMEPTEYLVAIGTAWTPWSLTVYPCILYGILYCAAIWRNKECCLCCWWWWWWWWWWYRGKVANVHSKPSDYPITVSHSLLWHSQRVEINREFP